jgi:hypothetical protein
MSLPIRTAAILGLMLLMTVGAFAQVDPATVPPDFPTVAQRAFWRHAVKIFMTRPSCCGGCQNSFTEDDLAKVRAALKSDAVDTAETRAVWKAWAPRLFFMLGRDPRLSAEYRAVLAKERADRSASQERNLR